MKKYKSIKIIPFPEIEHAFLVISCHKDDSKGNKVRSVMSFMWADEKGGAEWEPQHGPITRLIPCDKDDKEAQPHWFYPHYKGQGNWSQLAVDSECLPEFAINGDYESIFRVLKKWSKE